MRDRLLPLGIETELILVKTSGDVFLDKPLHQLTGFGVFVAEIDERMLSGEIDLAVHSMKDLPTKRPEELTISAILKRDSPYDIMLCRDGSAKSLEELKEGATVGTSSMRRTAQLRRARPDLEIKNLRGNLQTQTAKTGSGRLRCHSPGQGWSARGWAWRWIMCGWMGRGSFPPPTRER